MMRACRPLSLAVTLLYAGSIHAQPPFPSIDAPTQQRRDRERMHILDAELASERQALDAARQELAVTQSAAQPADKINRLREAVSRHQSNLAAIERERSPAGSAPVVLGSAPGLQQEQEAKESSAPFWDVYRRLRGRSAVGGAAPRKAGEPAQPPSQQQDVRDHQRYQHQN